MRDRLQVLSSPLVWLTLAYLVCELSFSARLLDAVAMASTFDDIHSLERFGRILSGTAMGLVVAGFLLHHDRPSRAGRTYMLTSTAAMLSVLGYDLAFGSEHATLALAGIVSGVFAAFLAWRLERWNAAVGALVLAMHVVMAVAAMFAFQTRLVAGMVAGLGEEDRRAAIVLAEAANRLSLCQVKMDEIFLCDGAATPSGKTFAAVFPLLGLGLRDLDERVLPVLETVAAGSFTTGCHPGEGRCIGTPEHFFNEAWRPLLAKVRDGAWAKYQAQVGSNWARGERAWEEYAARLAKRGWQPGTVPVIHWDRVRGELRKDGVKVSDDWRPFDRTGFQAAVDAEGERRLRQAHREKGLGSGTVPIQDFTTFFMQDGIQREIRKELGVSDSKLTFRPFTKLAEVRAQVYEPLVKLALRDYAREIGGAPVGFAERGLREDRADDAAHRAVVPPLALFFSLLGGGGHLLKLLVLLTAGVTANGAVRMVVSIVMVSALAWGPMMPTNPVVDTKAYENLEGVVVDFVGARLGEAGGRAAAWVLEWTIRAQQFFHPVNEWIRTRLLGGYEFGFGSEPGEADAPP